MENHIKAFFALSPDCLLLLSIENVQLLAVNEQACDFFGYEEEEFLELNISDIEADKDAIKLVSDKLPTLSTDIILELEGLGKRKNGAHVPIHIKLKKIDEERVLVSIREISEKKEVELLNEQLEKATKELENDKLVLQKSKEKLKEAQELAKVGIWEYYLEGRMIWSSQMYKLYQIKETSPEKLRGVYFSKIHREDLSRIITIGNQVIAEKKNFNYEHRVVLGDGSLMHMYGTGGVIQNSKGEVIGLKGIEQDITELKVARKVAVENEQKLYHLISNIDEIVFVVDMENQERYDNPITYINGDTLNLFGYSHEELVQNPNLWASCIHSDDIDAVLAQSEKLHSFKKQISREYRFLHRKGHYIWVRDNLSIGPSYDGKGECIYGSARDISEHKQTAELITSNEEKDILLKEIHHRVKNNLQVITSLLSLQSSLLSDKKQKRLFADSQYRINSMAMVHEMLYQSDNLSKLDYEVYLNELGAFLIRSMKGGNSNIKLEMDVPRISLKMDTAIPLGLLINEIITNSLKYGFPDGREGVITIKIEQKDEAGITGKTKFLLLIGDNGKGYSGEINHRTSKSLGLKLIKNLTRQLEGNVVRDNTKEGTHYIIEFCEI